MIITVACLTYGYNLIQAASYTNDRAVTNMDLAIQRIGLTPGILSGKTIIVTGAGRGIGKEIAKAFAYLGANIAVLDILDAGKETLKIIESMGSKGLFVKTDLAEQSNVEAAVKQVLESFGCIDILVNNAIVCPVGSVEETSVATWDRTIAVNLRGPFLLIKSLLPAFTAQQSGIIINLLSSAGTLPPEVGQAFMSAYSASKGGLAAFTLSLAPEVEQKGIRTVGIWVGITDTPGAHDAFGKLSGYLEIPFEQFKASMVPPDKTAAVIAYVAVNIEEFHGENVECEKLMEKLRLAETSPTPSEVPLLLVQPPPNTQADLEVIYQQEYENVENLLKVINEIKSGFDQLPFFVRPMGNRAFKSKTGASIKDWQSSIEEMMNRQNEWLNAYQKKDSVKLTVMAKMFVDGYPAIQEALNRLYTYIVESPKEAARFTKDQQTLQIITQTANRQATIVKAAQSTLKLTHDTLKGNVT